VDDKVIEQLMEYVNMINMPKYPGNTISLEASDIKKVKIVDFKRMAVLTENQKDILERIAANFASTWSHQVKEVSLYLASADQMTWEEMCRSIVEPSLIFKATFENHPLYLILDMTAATVLSVTIDKEEIKSIVARALEKAFCSLFYWPMQVEALFSVYDIKDNHYKNDMCVEMTLETHVNNDETIAVLVAPPETVRFLKPYLTEKTMMEHDVEPALFNRIDDVLFDLKAKASTTITLGRASSIKVGWIIKLDAIHLVNGDSVIAELDRNKKIIKMTKEEKIMEKVDIADTLKDVNVELSVELGRTRKSIKDILAFGIGSIVELDSYEGEPVKVYVNNVLFATGEVVSIEQNFGVRIVEILAKE
jgi:flagellar motor switch protein FliN